MVKVEIYDEEHERDLQYKINNFLSKVNESDIIDIKYSIHAFSSSSGRIFSRKIQTNTSIL